MVRHVVMFRFSADFGEDRLQEWLDRVQRLPEQISTIRSHSAGLDVTEGPRSWDAVVVSEFDSMDDVADYPSHPAHKPLIALCDAYTLQIATVDFMA